MGTVLVIVSFLAALVGIATKTTRENVRFPRNIRVGGWILILLAASSGYLTYAKERDDGVSRDIRLSVALQELEKSVYLLMSPAVALSDPPETSDRFKVSESYFSAGAVAGLCDVNLSTTTGRVFADPLYSNKEWGVFISSRTRDGLEQMRATQSSYGDVLGDRTNILIGRIVSHPWNEFLLVSQRRLRLGANKILCSDIPSTKAAYLTNLEGYRKLVEELERAVGKRFCALRRDHYLNDVAPVFLRSISGLIYAPNSERAKTELDGSCQGLQDAS